MKNNKWKGKKKWTCCPPLFARVFWAGNILKELPGLWSSCIKDLTFSLPTLPRFTIENLLSLWRACVLGKGSLEGATKVTRLPVYSPLEVFLKLKTTHQGDHTKRSMCGTSTNLTDVINRVRKSIARPRQQSAHSAKPVLSHPSHPPQYLHDISDEWQQRDEKLEISINPREIPPN